ncbi:MAG: VTT domain-containing protein [Patescibacteria group bacterium]
MQKKTFWYSSLFIIIFILTLVLFYWFFKSSYFLIVDTWVKANIILYVIYLFIFKTIGILFPPIPAGLVTMASIPFLGWFGAYSVDLLGSIAGGMIAYYLGRKYGHPLLLKILGEEITKKIEKIKIKKSREIEGIFVYRVALGSTILEAVYYGAGFLKIGFRNFLIGSILSHIVVGTPSFYLANNILNGQNIILTAILTMIGIIFIIFTKGRYFE